MAASPAGQRGHQPSRTPGRGARARATAPVTPRLQPPAKALAGTAGKWRLRAHPRGGAGEPGVSQLARPAEPIAALASQTESNRTQISLTPSTTSDSAALCNATQVSPVYSSVYCPHLLKLPSLQRQT